MEIEENIRNAAGGDPAATEAIIRRFERPIRAFAARWCPDPNLGEEIAQRTFVWAFDHLREYRAGTNFQAWLKAIARNLVLAELEVREREDRNRRQYLVHLEVARLRQAEPDEDDTEPRTAALRDCLDSLPPQSRDLVNDRYHLRRPLEQIARTRGTSEGGVKMLLLRVRQALKRCIEGRLSLPAAPEARHES